jgi:hypothetical protein
MFLAHAGLERRLGVGWLLGPEFGSRVVAPCRLPAVAGQGLRLFAIPFSAHRRSGASQPPMIMDAPLHRGCILKTHETNTKTHKQQPPPRPSMTIEGQFDPIQGSSVLIHDPPPQDPLSLFLVDPPCSGGF